MLQRGYKPNGWLGILIGAKFYINFDGKFTFNEAYNKLIQALAGRGKETGLVKKVAVGMYIVYVVKFGICSTMHNKKMF